MFKKMIQKIESSEITFIQWFYAFLGIMFLRFFFEIISNPLTNSGILHIDLISINHGLLFFLTISLGSILILGKFSGNYISSSKFVLFSLLIIWIAPVIDIILSSGKGILMGYIIEPPKEMFASFFKFLTFQSVTGITYGMHASYALILIIFTSYAWVKSKKIISAVYSFVSIYLFFFTLGSIPSLIFFISKINGGFYENIYEYFSNLIISSNLYHNTIPYVKLLNSDVRLYELGFEKLVSQFLFIILVILLALFFIKTNKNKLVTYVKNSRPERALYYTTPMIISIFFVYLNLDSVNFIWIDSFAILCLLISWFAVWMFSIHINDVNDYEIDKISNTNRPLVKDIVTKQEMKDVSFIYLLIAIFGSLATGYIHLFFVLVGLAVSYIYSASPLRLRRFPIITTFLMSVVILSATYSGFFLAYPVKNIFELPFMITLGILIVYTLQLNFKDIKDVEGDRVNGVITLSNFFKTGREFTALLFSLSYLLIPIFLNFYTLYLLAIPSAIIGYKILNKNPYKERNVFVIYFSFVILSLCIYMVLYSIKNNLLF